MVLFVPIQGRLDELFQRYRGTQKFHNFTSGVDPSDAKVFRFMEHFKVSWFSID